MVKKRSGEKPTKANKEEQLDIEAMIDDAASVLPEASQANPVGRPVKKVGKYKNTSVRMPESMHYALADLALKRSTARKRVSVNDLACKAINEFLKNNS